MGKLKQAINFIEVDKVKAKEILIDLYQQEQAENQVEMYIEQLA